MFFIKEKTDSGLRTTSEVRFFTIENKCKKICNCETNLYNVDTFISDKQEDEQKRESQRKFPQRSLHGQPLSD